MGDSFSVVALFILLMISIWIPREADKTKELHDLLIEVCERENALRENQHCKVIAVVTDK